MLTQIQAARKGIVTEGLNLVSRKEHMDAEKLLQLVAEGQVVIPTNIVHSQYDLVPMGIGHGLKTKVNANFGTSVQSFDLNHELAKLEICEKFGADTVMDLSIKGDLSTIRIEILKKAAIPVGTVPIYEVVEKHGLFGFDSDDCLTIIEEHAKQGVDYMTIHAGFRKDYIHYTKKRVTGVVSRGGGILGKWMEYHNRENPLYEAFEEICEIFKKYDVTFSLGDSLRPGGLVDCNDKAQLSELATLGELTQIAWQHGVQVMVEGPGHVPIHMIKEQIELEKRICHGAPFYVLGPLVIDTGAGYDHITGAIGGAVAAMHGADMLCYVTPAEHLRLPDLNDVKEGLIAFKIAASAADVAKGIPGAWEEQVEMSRYRKALNWGEQMQRSFDQEKFLRYRSGYAGRACSMCGDDFCPMNDKIDMERALKDKKTLVKRMGVEEEARYV